MSKNQIYNPNLNSLSNQNIKHKLFSYSRKLKQLAGSPGDSWRKEKYL